jgi:hypothetical protein
MMALVVQTKRRAKEFIYPLIYPRRFHAYCVGAMKTGTHSVDGIFAARYRSRHEPDNKGLRQAVMAADTGAMTPRQLIRMLRRRDRRLWLELDSSVFNFFVIDDLVREFPDSKFILTVRDCYSWLDSCFNHLLARDLPDYMLRFLEWWLKPETFRYAVGERVLEERKLPPVEWYLARWTEHNQHVIDVVPPDRLLIVKTREIVRDVPRMAGFLGIAEQTLDPGKSHLFKAAQKFDLISQIDKALVEDVAARHCKPLMERLFPEIRSLDDAFRRTGMGVPPVSHGQDAHAT